MIRGRAVWPPRLRRPAQRGQATVELAVLLPLIAVLLLTVVQAGLVVRDQLLITNAAREAARAAAVDPAADLAAIAQQRTGLTDVSATASGSGDAVTVTVQAQIPIRVPLLALVRPSVSLHATATMRVESG